MPKYAMYVVRTDTFTAAVVVEAASQREAAFAIEATLQIGGWAAVFGGNEGDYQDCASVVIPREPSSRDRRTSKTAQFVVDNGQLRAVSPSGVDAAAATG